MSTASSLSGATPKEDLQSSIVCKNLIFVTLKGVTMEIEYENLMQVHYTISCLRSSRICQSKIGESHIHLLIWPGNSYLHCFLFPMGLCAKGVRNKP